MTITETVFYPQTVDPEVGSCLVLYADTKGNPPLDPASGRITWKANDGGTVVGLSWTDTWLRVNPVGVGSAILTGTGVELGQVVTTTLTAVVTVGPDGLLVVAIEGVDTAGIVIDGGTPAAEVGLFLDGGTPGANVYVLLVDGGGP